jgi:hypothetical protein
VVTQIVGLAQRMLRMVDETRAADRRDGERDQLVHLEAGVVAASIDDGDVGIGEPVVEREPLRGRALAPALRGLAHPGGDPHVDLGVRVEEAVQPGHQPARRE